MLTNTIIERSSVGTEDANKKKPDSCQIFIEWKKRIPVYHET